jgi:hypothetical protein
MGEVEDRSSRIGGVSEVGGHLCAREREKEREKLRRKKSARVLRMN